MRISDWSSDVCSSDLLDRNPHPMGAGVDQPFPIRHQADMARKEDEVAAPEIARRHLLSKRRRLLVAVARRKDSAQAERKLDKAGAVQIGKHTSELQSLMPISHPVCSLQKKKQHT